MEIAFINHVKFPEIKMIDKKAKRCHQNVYDGGQFKDHEVSSPTMPMCPLY